MGRRSARPLPARLRRRFKIFLFVYRVRDRQRFLKIGKTPVWSLEAARDWAKELGAIVDQGGDPERHNRERAKFGPVEKVIRYIREELKNSDG